MQVRSDIEAAYRIYVTDSLYLSGQNKAYNVRFVDMMKRENIQAADGDEVAAGVFKRLNLKVKKDGCI